MATHDPRGIKKNFETSGQLVREAQAEALFSSMTPVEDSNIERNGWTECIHTLLHGVPAQMLGVLTGEWPGMLASDRNDISQ